MLENLRNGLIGKEMSFIELDNYMMDQGYYSVLDDGITEDIKNDLSVVYTSTETNEAEILINFIITFNNGEDESEEAFYLKVTGVESF